MAMAAPWGTITGIPMADAPIPDTGLLTLTQWLSPAFPVGSFAFSHGLEQAISDGDVADAAGLQTWLTDILTLGAGRADAILLCAALRGGDAGDLAALAEALAPSRERWLETRDQGSAFAAAVTATGRSIDPMPFPVAVGVAARALDLTPAQITQLFLHAFTSNLVSAAVRFVPLGQNAGQSVLSALHGVIAEVAEQAAQATTDDITSAVPRADLAAMRHETLEVRIFKT